MIFLEAIIFSWKASAQYMGREKWLLLMYSEYTCVNVRNSSISRSICFTKPRINCKILHGKIITWKILRCAHRNLTDNVYHTSSEGQKRRIARHVLIPLCAHLFIRNCLIEYWLSIDKKNFRFETKALRVVDIVPNELSNSTFFASVEQGSDKRVSVFITYYQASENLNCVAKSLHENQPKCYSIYRTLRYL